MASITIKLPSRRTVLVILGMAVLSAAIIGGAIYIRSDDSSAPTTTDVAGPANIGCVDEAGVDTRAVSEWYSTESTNTLVRHGELVSSLELGLYNGVATKAVSDAIGHFASSAVRDNAVNPSACVSLRYAGYDLDDGGLLQVIAWRLDRPANPNTLPNEGAFTPNGDDALVSTGPHAITALVVAPDGTTVMVAAYGNNGLAALTNDGVTNTIPTEVGAVSLTADQLLAIGRQVLPHVLERISLGS